MHSQKNGGVEAPICLVGLFDDESDGTDAIFTEVYDEQKLKLADIELTIRQFSWHEANANKVWPGTFVLSEFINSRLDKFQTIVAGSNEFESVIISL